MQTPAIINARNKSDQISKLTKGARTPDVIGRTKRGSYKSKRKPSKTLQKTHVEKPTNSRPEMPQAGRVDLAGEVEGSTRWKNRLDIPQRLSECHLLLGRPPCDKAEFTTGDTQSPLLSGAYIRRGNLEELGIEQHYGKSRGKKI